MIWLIQSICSYLSSVAFGVLTNVPKRTLNACGLTGMISWLIFLVCRQYSFGIGSANFLAAFFIGLASIYFSRKKKMPMIIFMIPSLVPLVPGGPAYKAVREFVLGNSSTGFQNFLTVIITSGAIAAAFMMTSLVETIVFQWHSNRRTRAKKQSD